MTMIGFPWEPIPGMKSCEIRVKIAAPRISEDIRERMEDHERPYVARRFRIKATDFVTQIQR